MHPTETLANAGATTAASLVNLDAVKDASPAEVVQAAAMLINTSAARAQNSDAAHDADTQEKTVPGSVAVLAAYRDTLGTLGPPNSEAEAIDRIQIQEQLKSATAANQARDTAVLEQLRHNNEAFSGIPKARRGKGLAAEIGLARGGSPARGTRHLNLANALTQHLPKTFNSLRAGRIHEEHAQIVATETAWLSTEHRREVDGLLTERLGTLGPRKLAAEVRGHAQRLDQKGALKRLTKTKADRRVSMRPAAQGMARLSALLPTEQAVAVYAHIKRGAATMASNSGSRDPANPTGKKRTRDQLMADYFVQRVTDQSTAPAIRTELLLVMTDDALFGDGQTPAWVTGHGPIPATRARHWLADPEAEIFLRRVFTRPTDGQLVGLESRSRTFPEGLRKMVALRDDTCRTPYCDATIRDIDHIRPVRDGGKTSWQNSSGLCALCNQIKENNGWRHQGDPHQLKVTTPTGHQYTADTPAILFGIAPNIGPTEAKPPDRKPQLRLDNSPYRTEDHTLKCTMVIAS